MSTFQELQGKLSTAKYRKAILEYVVNHLDGEFRPSAAGPAKKKILTEERVEVPQGVFEAEVAFLMEDIEELNKEIALIMASTLAPKPPEGEKTPETPEAKSDPKKKASKPKLETQGEAQ